MLVNIDQVLVNLLRNMNTYRIAENIGGSKFGELVLVGNCQINDTKLKKAAEHGVKVNGPFPDHCSGYL